MAIATTEPLTSRLAGPGIRALAIAQALAAEHDVQLVTTEDASRTGAGFTIRSVDDRGLRRIERWCDVLVVQGWMLSGRPFLVGTSKVLVCDLYDPLHLEALEQGRDLEPEARAASVAASTDVLNEQLRRGDFFLCASDRQRDFWLGHLASLGRINPVSYDDDPTLRALIAVVPFGIPATAPTPSGAGHPGRRARDRRRRPPRPLGRRRLQLARPADRHPGRRPPAGRAGRPPALLPRA